MSASRRRPHIALKRKTFEGTSKRRWVKKEDEEPRFFSDADELSTSLNKVKESAESKESKVKIYIDPNYYFEVSIRGKLYWQYIQNVIDKLSLKIKSPYLIPILMKYKINIELEILLKCPLEIH